MKWILFPVHCQLELWKLWRRTEEGCFVLINISFDKQPNDIFDKVSYDDKWGLARICGF